MVNIEQVEVIYFIKTFNARGEFNGYLSEYDKETIDGIIWRIKSTEYKRKGLPVVINRKLYNN